MNLSLLIIVPLLTAVSILFTKEAKATKIISLAGATLQLALALFLLTAYLQERSMGNTAPMLFEYNYIWFAPLHINYHSLSTDTRYMNGWQPATWPRITTRKPKSFSD